MNQSLSGSVGSWESGARNQTNDILTVQKLLTAVAQKLGRAEFDPRGIDGKISRTPGASNTVKAIIAFQRQVVGMALPDGRIDVNGATWQKLVSSAGTAPLPPVTPTPPAGPVGLITITVSHGGKIPTNTHYQPAVPATFAGMYESSIVVSGGLNGSFTGSIYPDDMMVKGRVKDGTYPVHLGFHKGGNEARQGADKLIVQTQGIRAGLLVNARNSVPVISSNPSKTTSAGINIHNGFNTSRGSDGCITLQPSDWSRFIQLFLDAFPNIDDWHTLGTNTGKQIGSLVIRQ